MMEQTLIIIFFAFCIVYWYQYIDDKRKNIKRTKIGKIKFPILVSLLIGISLTLGDFSFSSNCTEQAIFTEQPQF